MLCVQENSVERPAMREVVQMLSEFARHVSNYEPSPSSSEPEQAETSPSLEGQELMRGVLFVWSMCTIVLIIAYCIRIHLFECTYAIFGKNDN
ncbi:hypothetical protein FCM35_KLT13921 [Carex littledalei]|uniref:Uncharacterized protein n=1 Tax=Carex littledalei TaxID=544730 RepID=A0A833VDN8_9POAL|nr:hypothetical protein FCM35_KLT13921 [Carex littledalei]